MCSRQSEAYQDEVPQAQNEKIPFKLLKGVEMQSQELSFWHEAIYETLVYFHTRLLLHRWVQVLRVPEMCDREKEEMK